jgi:hypothetical protein
MNKKRYNILIRQLIIALLPLIPITKPIKNKRGKELNIK